VIDVRRVAVQKEETPRRARVEGLQPQGAKAERAAIEVYSTKELAPEESAPRERTVELNLSAVVHARDSIELPASPSKHLDAPCARVSPAPVNRRLGHGSSGRARITAPARLGRSHQSRRYARPFA
jgi:hypothetical protein